MPRKVEIALPSAQTGEVLEEIKGIKEIIALRLQQDVSLQPSGDVIQLEVTDRWNRKPREWEACVQQTVPGVIGVAAL